MRWLIRTGRAAHLACAVALGAGGLHAAAAVERAATDLGVVGPLYPIAEPNLLDEIQAQLSKAERDGSIARLQNEARARAEARLLDPPPLAGIAAARTARTHWYDPTVTFESPIVDADGRVLVAAGERRNPFDTVTYTRTLIFFDGRDPRQVDYVRRRMDEAPQRIKPITTGGSAVRLMREWKQPVYADQDGRLVRQLGITEVPAVVYQDGKRFRIDTVAVED
jgi:conjugal transfer pilus assembly protein TraW